MKLSGLFNFWHSSAEDPSLDTDSYLNHVPPEVMYNIAGYLSPGDIARLARVSKLHLSIANDEHIWEVLSERDFPDIVFDPNRTPLWKNFYKVHHYPRTLRVRVHNSYVETSQRVYQNVPQLIGRRVMGSQIYTSVIIVPIIAITLVVDRIILGADTFYDTSYQKINGLGHLNGPYLPFTDIFNLAVIVFGIGVLSSARFRRIILPRLSFFYSDYILDKCLRIGERIFSNDFIRRPVSVVAGKINALYTRIFEK